jgi:hypothetical protein
MKKQILNLIVLFLFWGCLYVISTKVWGILKFNHHYYLKAFYATAFFVSLGYKSLWSLGPDLNKTKKLKYLSSLLLLFAFLTYSSLMFDRARGLYTFLVSEEGPGRTGAYHQADDEIGHTQIPNSRAFRTFTMGPSVPVVCDQDGFRVPLTDTLKVNTPNDVDILFLGCSFTYGDACHADSIFAHLVGEELEFKYINAGVCAYGLSEMMVVANKLIPKYKPKYTIIQHSPWIVPRAMELYGPAYYGSLPHAYFSKTESGSYQVNAPIFKSQIFDLDPIAIRKKYNDRFVKFTWDVIIPFYLKEDFYYAKTLVDLHLLKKISPPANNVEGVKNYAYDSLIDLATKNGSTPIILKIGFSDHSPDTGWKNSLSTIVDSDAWLMEYLKSSETHEYAREFHHWHNTGAELIKIDHHPNTKAHAIIAKSIVDVIQNGTNHIKHVKHVNQLFQNKKEDKNIDRFIYGYTKMSTEWVR